MKPKLLATFTAALALAALATVAPGQDPAALTVHEWGTFTSLQDEAGQAVGGINTDDEPVPTFVHDVAGRLLIKPTEVPPIFFQGAPSCHPDVTMRLETPVLYFHAPEGFRGTVNVHVGFHGGWLTQFYPQAAAVTPGIREGGSFGHLTDRTLGTLDWRGLAVEAAGDGPATDEHVWLSPRAVRASGVRTQDGEREKFLFYRGVGHLDAPVRVVRSADGSRLEVQPGQEASSAASSIHKFWLVDIRPDGTAAYRTLQPATPEVAFPRPLASTAAGFADGEYAAANVGRLRVDLRADLVAEGLFEDEADALLNTWELSYFKSAGLRLFFLVPQPWTDAVLPLTVSGVPSVTRVMVGRIELVTPQQRELLGRLAAAPAMRANLDLNLNALDSPANRDYPLWNEVFAGRKTLAQAGVKVPAAYRAYLDLGRFRNALLLDEEGRHGSACLTEFIKEWNLAGYQVPDDDVAAR